MMQDDASTFQLIRDELFTAVVGDVLDKLGFHHQFLSPGFAPLDDRTRLIGRAMPVLEADVFLEHSETVGPLAAKPFGLMFEALDSLLQGEVYVATGASLRYALWGGLMSTRARHLGASGALLNGYVRDKREILALDFPVFSRGVYAQDQGPRGKVVDFRTTIEIDAVRIAPGDLLFGDAEGVLVIPRDVEETTIRLALEKVRTESKVATAIRGGMSAREAFDQFGVM